MSEWFYTVSGQRRGPATLSDLLREQDLGTFGPNDLVWRSGMKDWAPASSIPELGSRPSAQAQPRPVASLGTVAYAHPSGDAVLCSPRGVDLLRQTGPWARLIGILCIIMGVLAAIGGIFILLIGTVATRQPFSGLIGLVYAAMAGLYIVPGVYLNRYASRIAELVGGRREQALESALEAQKSFWKFVGIATLVVIGCWVLLILFAIAGAAFLR